jgi:hypothetical protein
MELSWRKKPKKRPDIKMPSRKVSSKRHVPYLTPQVAGYLEILFLMSCSPIFLPGLKRYIKPIYQLFAASLIKLK